MEKQSKQKKSGWIVGIVIMSALTFIMLVVDVVLIVL